MGGSKWVLEGDKFLNTMMYMDSGILEFVGRLLFGGYFLYMGLNHVFLKTDALTGYAQMKGVSNARTAVIGSGLLILVGGLGVVLGQYTRESTMLIAIFLVGVTFKMHAFWNDADPVMKMNDEVQFYKNMALLGASLAF